MERINSPAHPLLHVPRPGDREIRIKTIPILPFSRCMKGEFKENEK